MKKKIPTNIYIFAYRKEGGILQGSLTGKGKPKRQSRTDIPQKTVTLGTQDEDKQNKKHNVICV